MDIIEVNLAPIQAFADEDAVDALNSYFDTNGMEITYPSNHISAVAKFPRNCIDAAMGMAAASGAVVNKVMVFDDRDYSFRLLEESEFAGVYTGNESGGYFPGYITFDHVWIFTPSARDRGVRFVFNA